MREPLDRRSFLAATGVSLASAALAQDSGPEAPRLTHGPFMTIARHTKAGTEAGVWARAVEAGEYTLRVFDEVTKQTSTSIASTDAAQDFTLRWSFSGVNWGPLLVHASISRGELTVWRGTGEALIGLHARGGVVFGSCADERRFTDQQVWDRMREREPELVVLLGDTPYIDTTDLAIQRERYRAFYSQPQFAELARKVPFVGTWDDHDYAGNDKLGAVEGRENSRRAFLEYHGPGEWGENEQGIYTRRRVGPIEVFLLDTRWFADTEPSTFDASKKTLLGAAQWKWLQKGLLESDAPFKVLASGMIWNDATRPLKRDWWGNWPHERDGLFRWLGENKIAGVVLVAGDIHRTRVVQHATKDIVGYDIVELITSPIANTVIDSANASHPGLLFDAGVEQSFLALTAKPDTGSTLLTAEHIDGAGKRLFWLERYAFTLRAK